MHRVVDDVVAEPRQQGPVDVEQCEGADDHATERPDPTQDDDDHDQDRNVVAERLREDRRVVGTGEGAGEPREARAE